MGKRAKRDEATQRLAEAAKAERRLLKRERRAERELHELRDALHADEARLRRAQDRVARRQADIAAAEERLRQRQTDRARGPQPPSAPVAAEVQSDASPSS